MLGSGVSPFESFFVGTVVMVGPIGTGSMSITQSIKLKPSLRSSSSLTGRERVLFGLWSKLTRKTTAANPTASGAISTRIERFCIALGVNTSSKKFHVPCEAAQVEICPISELDSYFTLRKSERCALPLRGCSGTSTYVAPPKPFRKQMTFLRNGVPGVS